MFGKHLSDARFELLHLPEDGILSGFDVAQAEGCLGNRK